MIKRIILLAFIGFLALSNMAFAYTINDLIDNPTNWQNGPVDRVGDAVFELYGINVFRSGNNLTFDIYTNYPNDGNYPTDETVTVGSWKTFPGDLAIDADSDGIYEYGLAVTSHDGLIAGSLYNVNNWFLSNHYAVAGLTYNTNQIVTIASGSLLANSSSVARYWNDLTHDRFNGIPDFVIRAQFDITGSNGFNDSAFNVHYATATCANDYVKGSVTPEPASISLLGIGLLGLLGIRRKK
ncbi:MAG: PEP-CTERM sorting domain-containing protein [Candidatus Omnitrophota bacterium]